MQRRDYKTAMRSMHFSEIHYLGANISFELKRKRRASCLVRIVSYLSCGEGHAAFPLVVSSSYGTIKLKF